MTLAASKGQLVTARRDGAQIEQEGRQTMALKQRFPIGMKFCETRGRGKRAESREYVIVDVLRTYNSKNQIVSLRYVTECDFMGQKLINKDVLDTTIAKLLHREGRELPVEIAT